jgi:hypothetical protein
MLVKLKQQVKELEATEQYKIFQKDNPDIFLASAFFTTSDINNYNWELNYYSPLKHKHILFKDKVEEQEVFQKTEHKLEELNLNEVKVSLEQAWQTTETEVKPYSLAKAIVVLQVQDSIIWNITYITNELKFINLRIDAKTGKLIKKQESSITDMRVPPKPSSEK